MRVQRVLAAMFILVLVLATSGAAQTTTTLEQYISPAWPSELVAARTADRVAWIAYERGRRNVYTAAAPAFRPVRLTAFLEDDGIDLTGLGISDDGSVVTFVRGHTPNRDGWVANPTSDPNGAERAVWAARTTGGPTWRLAETTNPVLSPDGRWVAFAKDDQIYRVPVSEARTTAVDRGEQPLVRAWGTNRDPRWSPDSSKLAFVSDRVDHSLIAVYDVRTRTVAYLAPGVDRDTSPTWSPDGKRIAFIRQPGLPFGRQLQGTGTGAGGQPDGAGRGTAASVLPLGLARQRARQREIQATGPADGMMQSAFEGGYTLAFLVAEVATGAVREFWHNQPEDKAFSDISEIQWADADHVIFQAEPEEWIRYHSAPVSGENPTPITLTPGAGMVKDVALSPDGRTLFYCTNAGDLDRRHIYRVPTSGGTPVPLTQGEGIETSPAALASGNHVAVLSATFDRPQSVTIVAARGGAPQVVFPALDQDFPAAAHVMPQNVVTQAPDGLEIHNQLFLPRDIEPGERRPAIVFVHGGPLRQTLLGYHYRFFYQLAYGVNQWLAGRGYIVLSVNYRSGIGYGRSFRMAPNTSGEGNAEYQDVLAGAHYLQGRQDVDPERIGIWGRSYGGLLTAQALARNSDVFKVGVEFAGVVLRGSSLDPSSVSYQSSAISHIDTWKSPVLIGHADDDRNVPFSQTTGLVQLLRAHGVYYELIMHPDDVHSLLLHRRWVHELERTVEFLGRFLMDGQTKRPWQ